MKTTCCKSVTGCKKPFTWHPRSTNILLQNQINSILNKQGGEREIERNEANKRKKKEEDRILSREGM